MTLLLAICPHLRAGALRLVFGSWPDWLRASLALQFPSHFSRWIQKHEHFTPHTHHRKGLSRT